jgi:membrane-bound inhibitor of C-type lysozyme
METHMKLSVPLTFGSALLVSACAGFPQNDPGSQAMLSPSAHHYQCKSGKTIAATYNSTDSARVQYEGTTYDLHIAVSGSGARYVGDELEWWTKGSGKGSEGTLFQHMDDGTSGDIIERCQEV